jgi:hypothetical protein
MGQVVINHEISLESVITCPECGFQREEVMRLMLACFFMTVRVVRLGCGRYLVIAAFSAHMEQ